MNRNDPDKGDNFNKGAQTSKTAKIICVAAASVSFAVALAFFIVSLIGRSGFLISCSFLFLTVGIILVVVLVRKIRRGRRRARENEDGESTDDAPPSNKYSGLPYVGLVLDLATAGVFFLGTAAFFSGVFAAFGLALFLTAFILPVLGIAAGLLSLFDKEKKTNKIGKAVAITAIALPVIAVIVIAVLFGTGTAVISLM